MTRVLLRRGLGALAAVASMLAATDALAQKSSPQKDIETRCLADSAVAESKDVQAFARSVSAACTQLLARPDLSITQEWNAYARRAMAAEILLDYAGAAKDYGDAIEHAPAGRPLAELHYSRGQLRIALGDDAGGEADAAEAVSIEPSLRVQGVPQGVHGAYFFCTAYAVSVRIVLKACERVMAAKPTHPEVIGKVQVNRGKALLVSGEPFRAIEVLGSAIYSGASPGIVAGAHSLRSQAYKETGQMIAAEGDRQRMEEVLASSAKPKPAPR